MTSHGWIGYIGQAELAKHALVLVFRTIGELANGKKALQCEFQYLLAEDFRLQRSADQRRTAAQDCDVNFLEIRFRQQPFFCRCTLPAQTSALPYRKSLA